MRRQDVLLAVLAASGGDPYSPAQIQKAMFLVDRNVSKLFAEGLKYNFVPYDYGPFDKQVYEDVHALASDGGHATVSAATGRRWNEYRATAQGVARGTELLNGMNEKTAAYIREVSTWVRSLTFSQLVSAIYREYPEMKENSVFQ